MTDAVVAFVHAEAGDPARQTKVVTKALKNIKWLAGKFDTRRVVLHSFAHLGPDKAPPELAQEFLQRMQERLTSAGYEVAVTPFGYFNEFRMHVAGPSLAKVFVEI